MRVPVRTLAFISAPSTTPLVKSGSPSAWPYSCSSTVSRSNRLAASVPGSAVSVPDGPVVYCAPLVSRNQPDPAALASMVIVSPSYEPMAWLDSRPTRRLMKASFAPASEIRPLAIQFARASAATRVTSSSVSSAVGVPMATVGSAPV